jgi:hypothetical protein
MTSRPLIRFLIPLMGLLLAGRALPLLARLSLHFWAVGLGLGLTFYFYRRFQRRKISNRG